MAIMYPKSIDDTARSGEKQMYNILQKALPETYHVWFDTRINKRYPDFIILNPELGIIVLEVKDWDIRHITKADKNRFHLLSKETKKNPLEQARDYTYLLVDELKKSTSLVQKDGQYKGNLAFTYGFGVVLWNIEHSAFVSKFGDVLDDDFVIFQEEFTELKNGQTSMADRLAKMFPRRFVFTPLSNEQMDEIKKTLNGHSDAVGNLEPSAKLEPIDKPATQEQPTTSKKLKVFDSVSVKKICISLCVCLLIAIGIYGLHGSEQDSPVTNPEQSVSIANSGIISEFEGSITLIESYDNGAIRLNIDNGFESQEVYINQDIDVDQFQFILDSEYKFQGELVEYNGTMQLHPTTVENITCIQINNFYPALVTKIVDGDTIYAINENNEEIKIRFIGMNCPELNSDGEAGELASEYTEAMILNKTVFLEKDISETDIYGRDLRYIWLELPESRDIEEVAAKMLNAQLIIEGYAEAATYPPDTKYEEIFKQF